MYIFKYHPDNVIYRNGTYVSTFPQFMAENAEFPLIEGEFFEYSEDGLDLISPSGNHSNQADLAPYADLIAAIELLP